MKTAAYPQALGKQDFKEFKKESRKSLNALQNPDPASCGSTTVIALDPIIDFLTEWGWYTDRVRSSSSVNVLSKEATRLLVHSVTEE